MMNTNCDIRGKLAGPEPDIRSNSKQDGYVGGVGLIGCKDPTEPGVCTLNPRANHSCRKQHITI